MSEPDPIRVVLVDDHPAIRDGVRADLESSGVAAVVGEADDGGDAIRLVRATSPDVVVMDLNMPNVGGIDAIREIVRDAPDAKILVLSLSGAESDVLEAVKVGAAGYLLKTSTAEQLVDGVRRVHEGDAVFTPALAGLVLSEFRRAARPEDTTALSEREDTVLRLVAKGYTYAEIAQQLFVSPETVQEYLRDVLAKLHVSDEDDRVAFDRALATVLFTDIVGSSEQAAALGDRAWKGLIHEHHAKVRALLAHYRGREVDTAGDGFFATFDGPGRAVRCAQAVVRTVGSLGIQVRAGLHTGEVETIDGKAGGIAVVIGARIGGLASPSEVLASQTVRDLTAGSGIAFEDVGEHELKGVPDRWRIYRIV